MTDIYYQDTPDYFNPLSRMEKDIFAVAYCV